MRLFALIIALFFQVDTQAALILVTATGTVTNSRDDTNRFGLGAGRDTIDGATVTATWLFDSSHSGVDLYPSGTRALYDPQIDWIESSVNIDTTTVDTYFGNNGPITSPDLFPDYLEIHNEWEGNDSIDQYRVYSHSEVSATGEYYYSASSIFSWTNDIITSLDPSQTLEWLPAADEYGSGEWIYSNNSQNDIVSRFNYDLTSFTVELVAVPIPAAAWLFASALLGLGAIKRGRA